MTTKKKTIPAVGTDLGHSSRHTQVPVPVTIEGAKKKRALRLAFLFR